MLVGAVMGFWAVQRTPRLGWSLAIGGPASPRRGRADGADPRVPRVTLRANQIVSGLALTIFAGAAGLSSYLGNDLDLADAPAEHQFAPFLPQGCATRRSSARSCSTRTALVYVSWVCVVLVALVPRAHAAGPERARGRRVARRRRRDGDQRRRVPLRAHARRRRVRRRRRRVFSLAITPQWVDGLTRRRRLDRDRARDLRLLAAGALPGRRVPLRRVPGAAVHVPGARRLDGRAAGALPGAAVRDDDRRARRSSRRRARGSGSARRPRSASRTCARSVSTRVRAHVDGLIAARGDEAALVRETTACTRSRTPSFASIRATCVLTVVSPTTSSAAISTLASPRAIERSTSCSRSVSSRRRSGAAPAAGAVANSLDQPPRDRRGEQRVASGRRPGPRRRAPPAGRP